ncbi:MAG: phosphodiesterase [Cyanobacteria bacterium SID2]|nr:phosphodiesterase [Cyanobacteria bacterium SID2]MBP0005948.1 phosphodiesterase [Cyanobacteria bacterium SBC]
MIKIAQITDTHLLSNPNTAMRGVATWHSLKAILGRVKLKNPDLLLLTGDLADEGQPQAYDRLFELIEPLQIPTYWIPGNHDRLETMNERLHQWPFVARQNFTLGDWSFILLDSTIDNPKFGEGYFSEQTLANLEKTLNASHHPVAIALHHHPIVTGIDWLDTIDLVNATDFLTILERFDRVKLVLFGHVHLEVERTYNGIQFYGTPSTCTQVLPENAIERDRYPGFRWLELNPDGTHHSQVIRIPPHSIEPC